MSEKNKKITKQLKAIRAARRKVDIEMDLPKEHSKVWKTHKKDHFEKENNDIKQWDA